MIVAGVQMDIAWEDPPTNFRRVEARLEDLLAATGPGGDPQWVVFDDGSVGWYEAGWGPMMSETAFFVKDVIGTKGCVSIVASKSGGAKMSADIDSHTQTESLLVHYSDTDDCGQFRKEDEFIDLTDEPDHDELCKREQLFFLNSIRENIDLTDHWNDAVNSMRIVLAADESIKTGRTVILGPMDE